jgi:hypothetical protein
LNESRNYRILSFFLRIAQITCIGDFVDSHDKRLLRIRIR